MKNKFSAFLILVFLIISIASPVSAQGPLEPPTYIIQPGDSLGEVAAMFGISTTDLIQFNTLANPDVISPGQIIKIPSLVGITGIITPVVIGLGESANGIAIRFQTDEDKIVELNRITDFSELYSGSRILVPVSETAPELQPVAVLDHNKTFLEESVLLRSSPNSLLILNQKPSDILIFPGDVVFKKLNSDEKGLNQVSSAIEELSISPLPLNQGATAIVHLTALQPLSFEGQLNGHKLLFYTTDNKNYYALQGIHAMATPGLTEFTLSGQNGTETVFSYEQNILLKPGNFELDPPLIVAPEMIDPATTRPEEAYIENLTSNIIPQKYWTGIFMSPAYYQEYNSLYGNRRTYNDSPEVFFHTGVDFAGGMTLPIVAPADGKVVFAGPLTVRGNATFIDHGRGVFSGFFHQSKVIVQVGDMVTKGQIIGEVGNSGRVNGAEDFPGAGAHLHWELWVNGVQVNPLDWLDKEYP